MLDNAFSIFLDNASLFFDLVCHEIPRHMSQNFHVSVM